MREMGPCYFLDESGHSGDLVRGDPADAFGGQPTFTVAAVRLDAAEETAWSERLQRLLPAGWTRGELKSDLLKRRPKLAHDILGDMLDAGLPRFIEIVDKRYFLCVHLLEQLILGPWVRVASEASDWGMRNRLSDRLYDLLPDAAIAAYSAACQTPGHDSLRFAFNEVLRAAETTGRADQASEALRELTWTSLEDYLEMRSEDPQAHLRFLPAPDEGLNARTVWVLPNLSAFTNIYARINRRHRRDLQAIRLIHDNQRYYEAILRQAKADAETLGRQEVEMFTPEGDYRFASEAQLAFADSADHLGLQLADLLAGFCMRVVRGIRAGERPAPAARALLRRLLEESEGHSGEGVNLVTTERAYAITHKMSLG